MAIKILTLEEARITKERCAKYSEYYHELRGAALFNCFCDNSDVAIPLGNECAACVVLPSENHPNKQHQVDLLTSYVRPL